MEAAIPPLVTLGIKIIDYFQNKRSQPDAIRNIDHHTIGEHVSRPLVRMHAALVKADSELDIYLTMLANANGPFKDILVNNHRQFFVSRVEEHLQTFFDNISAIEQSVPAVLGAVKGKTCASRGRHDTDLKRELSAYAAIAESGGQFTAADIVRIIGAYQKVTACYSEGVEGALGDLPHAKY